MGAGASSFDLELLVRGVSKGVAEALNAAAKGTEDMAKRVEAASKKADDALRKAGERMDKVGEDLAAGFTSTAKTVVTAFEAIALAAGTALVGAFAAAGNEARKFDAALGELRGLNVSEEDLRRYHDTLLAVRATTSVGLIDLTKGLYDTIKSGVRDATVATELLNVAQMASVAAGGSVSANAKVLATALNTFGKEATTTAEKVAFLRESGDKLNAIIQAGKFEVDDFESFLGKVAPTAAAAGLTLDDVGAALTTLAESGVAPKAAFASLESLLEKMLVPSAAATKAADALGVEFGESALKANGFRGTLETLTTSTGGSRVALDALLGDTGAVNAAMLLAGDTTAKFDSKLKEIGDSAGGLASDFKVAEEEIDHRISRIWGNVLDDLIPAFERMKPAIADALESVARFVSENGAKMADALSSVLGVLQGIFGVLIDHKEVILSILAAIFATKILDTFLGGIVAVTKGLGGVGDAFKTMGAIASGTLKDTEGKLVSGAGKVSAFAGAVSTIGGAFLALAPVVIAVVDAIITQIGKAQRELEKFVLATNKAVAEASKTAITETTRRFEAIAKEINDLAAKDITAARDRAEALIAAESETLARRRANIEAFNARLKAERKRLADEEERERISGIDKGAEETKARIIEIEAGLAAERHAMEEEVKIRGFLAEFTSDKIKGERKAVDDATEHKKARTKDEADAVIAGLKTVADARAKDRVDYAAYQEGLTRTAEEEAKKRADLEAIRSARRDEISAATLEALKEGFAAFLDEPEVGKLGSAVKDPFKRGIKEAWEEGTEQAVPGIMSKLGGALGNLAAQFGQKLAGVAADVGNFFLDLFVTGPLAEFMDLLSLAAHTPAQGDPDGGAQGFAEVLDETLQGFIDVLTNLVANLPTLLGRVIEFLPDLISAFIDSVPDLVDAFVSNIGPLIDAILASIPRLTDAFADNVGPVIDAVVEQLPQLVQGIAQQLGPFITALFESDAVPQLIGAIIDSLGILLPAIIDLVDQLVSHFMETAPGIILDLVGMIVRDLIPSIIREIPQIIDALIGGLPDFLRELIGGLISLLTTEGTNIAFQIIKAILDILVNTHAGLDIAIAIVRGIVEGLVDAAKEIGEAIGEWLFGGPDKKETANDAYERDLAEWQAEAAGQSQEWLAANPPPALSDYQAHTGGLILPTGKVQHFRMGGIVAALQQAFQQAGPREVPILAEPGEAVLTPSQQAQLLAAANGGGSSRGNVYNFMPGSAVIVDGQRSIDAVMGDALEKGTGRVGKAMRSKAPPPIRPVPRFGVG